MLDIQHLTRRYQNKLAVSDLSLTFETGKTYALLGPNGSGKTTLMKMIAGLTKQTSGEITLDGIPVGPETKKHNADGKLLLLLHEHRGRRQVLCGFLRGLR